MTDSHSRLQIEAVLRVGEVTEITGRRVTVSVDKDKNLSELFFNGHLIKNVGVGSYIDIRNGYLSIIGKVNGENSRPNINDTFANNKVFLSKRSLSISLVGYIDSCGVFFGGTKEVPFIGNEAFLLTNDKLDKILNLVSGDFPNIDFAMSYYEGLQIRLPLDGLMNSHIAIFGNTRSGKSNTLAAIYQNFIKTMQLKNIESFEKHSRIIFFDLNGEFSHKNCLTTNKYTYVLSITNNKVRIPLSKEDFLNIETLSILSDSVEKKQKLFLIRTIELANNILVNDKVKGHNHLLNFMRQEVIKILQLSDKVKAFHLIEYFKVIFSFNTFKINYETSIDEGLEFQYDTNQPIYSKLPIIENSDDCIEVIKNTEIYRRIDSFEFTNDLISNFVIFSYVQLIWDVLNNKVESEQIAPTIHKLVSRSPDIQNVFDLGNESDIFKSNVIVLDLHDVNIEMQKTLQWLICKRIYKQHKKSLKKCTLNIVIDEAHDILSYKSSREAKAYKNYRLETFEEIINEGRKFGVYVTIASQHPSDISQTITSQAHNYFIHRLSNQKDIQAIASAVPYIDKETEELIPTLPTGTCLFSGLTGQMPMKLSINLLDEIQQPKSKARTFSKIISTKIKKLT